MTLQIAHGLLRAVQICVCICTMSAIKSTRGEKNHSHCAYFEFFNISDYTMNLAENTQVELTFSLIENCTEISLHFMNIYKFDIQNFVYIPVCRIVIKDNVCVPKSESVNCRCLTENGFYLFTKILYPSDSTKWMWSSSGKAPEIIVNFNVTYPSQVLSLTVDQMKDSDLVSTHTKILIRCSLKKGNPATNVHLLNNNTTLLTSNGDVEEINHNISFVHCFESGIIICKSDGPRNRMSAKYHASCPPEFLNTTFGCYNSSRDVLPITFFIYAAPTQLTDCTLTRHLNEEHVSIFRKHQCHVHSSTSIFLERKCECIINGTAPYLSLIAYILDVTENDDGKWNISISNNAGSAQHTFCVHVYDKAVSEVNTDPLNLSLIAWVVGAVAITIFSCIACKFITRKANCYHAWRNKTLRGPVDHSLRKNNISKSAAMFPIISLDTEQKGGRPHRNSTETENIKRMKSFHAIPVGKRSNREEEEETCI